MNEIMTFALLLGLELVLGIDNILLISIVTSRLPKAEQALARRIALGLAFGLRVLFVLGASALTRMVDPVLWGRSWRELILISGGCFLIFKAVREIHHVVEGSHNEGVAKPAARFSSAILTLLALDAVFSIDSVITAVGLTDHLLTIICAVLASFILVLFFSTAITDIITAFPALKILALAFLVTIGVTLFIEGMGHHVPKSLVYLPMGFALVVELLQMRFETNRRKL